MSTRKRSEPNDQPIGPEAALQILFSAVGYVMKSGLRCQAGNAGGRLVLYVTGAGVEYADGKARFLVTVNDQDVTVKSLDSVTVNPEQVTVNENVSASAA